MHAFDEKQLRFATVFHFPIIPESAAEALQRSSFHPKSL
jgi:hypothetical protein